MNTLETDIEISADGSVKLLSPLPAWLKPGRVHAVMTQPTAENNDTKAKRQPTATPEMIAKRLAAYEGLRALGGLDDVIPDPAAWQRELRADRPLPGTE